MELIARELGLAAFENNHFRISFMTRIVNLDYRDLRIRVNHPMNQILLNRKGSSTLVTPGRRETVAERTGATVEELMKRTLPSETHDSHCTEARDADRKKLASRWKDRDRARERARRGKRVDVKSDERDHLFLLLLLLCTLLSRLFNRVHSCSLRAGTERHATLSPGEKPSFWHGTTPPSCLDNC